MNTTDRFHDALAIIATRRTASAITPLAPPIGRTQGTRADRERAGIDRLARDLRTCGQLWDDDRHDLRPAA
jgi:hypothetical protein